MMKTILIVCVNYNSYDELNRFLLSVNESSSYEKDANVEVLIADNSTEKETVDSLRYSCIKVRQICLDNLGYLGGAQEIINGLEDIVRYSYIIISNVDLTFDKNTINRLICLNVENSVAWIAPSIFSKKYRKDLNPNILQRYKYWKLMFLKLTYNRYVYMLYNKFYFSKKMMHVDYPAMDIYAGHGAIMILTSAFFKRQIHLNYPIFLYGEELYLAELIKSVKMRVVYEPSIRVETTGGVSTSKMPSRAFFNYNKKAINYILKKFY